MAILVNRDTRVLVQGITGREGEFHASQMLAYGTQVVGGVTPGKGELRACDGRVRVYDTVAEAVADTGADTSVIFVPARTAVDAIFEAAEAGIALIVCITEGIPVQDMVTVRAFVQSRGARLIGPNCPGLLTPGQAKVGIMPGYIATPGGIGVVSRSGTLTYEIVYALTSRGIGQSTCVGIGGDPLVGTSFVEVLRMFQEDPATEAIVLIGEIGGNDEERAAQFISTSMDKPVVGYVAGTTAPPGRRMGHAGAIIEGGTGTAAEKQAALRAAGARVAERLEHIPLLLAG